MPLEEKPVLHLFLGRHETAASGLWIFNKTFVGNILGHLEELSKRGQRVPKILITFGEKPELRDDLEAVVRPLHLDISLRGLPCTYGSRRLSLLADLITGRYPAALTHGTANAAPLRSGASNCVLTLHDLLQAYSPVPAESIYIRLRRRFYRFLLRLQCRSADVILTGHEVTKKSIQSLVGKEKDVRVVHLPLDAAYSNTPLIERDDSIKSFLVFASRDPRKNIDTLLRAFKAWPYHTGWRVKVVSNSPAMTRALQELSSSLGLTGSVEFLENVRQDEMPLLYASSHALLFPSLQEGFGYPMYEALSQGIPVLCAKNAIIEPLKDQVRLGVVDCSSLDEAGLAEGLTRIALLRLSREDRETISRAVRDYLSADNITSRIEAIYRELAPGLFGEA